MSGRFVDIVTHLSAKTTKVIYNNFKVPHFRLQFGNDRVIFQNVIIMLQDSNIS